MGITATKHYLLEGHWYRFKWQYSIRKHNEIMKVIEVNRAGILLEMTSGDRLFVSHYRFNNYWESEQITNRLN